MDIVDKNVEADESTSEKTKVKNPRVPKTTQQRVYTSQDFADFKTLDRDASSIVNANTPLKIETIVCDRKLEDGATPEEVAEYEEATGSVKACIMKGKKSVNPPILYLARHRKKPRKGTSFKDKTYMRMTHEQVSLLRKAPTNLSEVSKSNPNDSKYDWLMEEMAPGCVWVLIYPVNLNEGVKIAGPDGKMVSAPVEMRYFPRMFIGRLELTDTSDEKEAVPNPGELLHVPPSVQVMWLNDPSIDRGSSIEKAFDKKLSIEETFRIPLKFDVKEWVDALKEGDGSGKKRSNGDTSDTEKKEKKPPKAKKDAKTNVKAAEGKTSKEVKVPAAKRAKTDTVTTEVGDNTIAQLAEEARKQGKQLTLYKMVIS